MLLNKLVKFCNCERAENERLKIAEHDTNVLIDALLRIKMRLGGGAANRGLVDLDIVRSLVRATLKRVDRGIYE